MRDELIETLFRKAKGYSKKEKTAEYLIDEQGNRKLVKEKVQIKHYPPDNTALKSYLDFFGGKSKYEDMSDEELEEERLKLINELAETEKKEER